MKNLHTITVKYLPATSTNGSRVKLISELFGDSKILDYDYAFSNTIDIATSWLEKNGYRPCFVSEGKDAMMIHCFVSEPLKAAPIAEEWNYYAEELKKVSNGSQVQAVFSTEETSTRTMGVNYESSRAITEWLARS